MITQLIQLIFSVFAGTAGSPSDVRDVQFCEIARSPASYDGQIVRVHAIASGNLDNIPLLISRDCGDGPDSIIYSNGDYKAALEPLNAYRVPESVMQAGAFDIWATYTGRIQREPVRTGYQNHDTGYHFLPISVTNIEAKHVRLCGDASDTTSGSCWSITRHH